MSNNNTAGKPTYETQMSQAFRAALADTAPHLRIAKRVQGALDAKVGIRNWRGFRPFSWIPLVNQREF